VVTTGNLEDITAFTGEHLNVSGSTTVLGAGKIQRLCSASVFRLSNEDMFASSDAGIRAVNSDNNLWTSRGRHSISRVAKSRIGPTTLPCARYIMFCLLCPTGGGRGGACDLQRGARKSLILTLILSHSAFHWVDSSLHASVHWERSCSSQRRPPLLFPLLLSIHGTRAWLTQ
jgi:hypothetical protein